MKIKTDTLFQDYMHVIDSSPCYIAGLPGYPRNFSRDTMLAGIIATDPHLLDSQLAMSGLHQGKRYNTLTGEEPGKIHHEFPGVVVREPYLSTYNACDTTALYLIGLEFSHHLTPDASLDFLNDHRPNIERALTYIRSHTHNDIFWEHPPKDAGQYSLNITYWKDSILPSSSGAREPIYPVSYALAHFQVARGVLASARLLDRQDLHDMADAMYEKGIATFITEDSFCVLVDRRDRLEQVSSDELHALAYVPSVYAQRLPFKAIRRRVVELITDAGIACTPKEISNTLSDTYHGYVVWIFEQAMIHYGCTKFGLDDIAEITKRCIPYIGTGQEFLTVIPKVMPSGNSHQLWSVAAKVYFSEADSLQSNTWL
ncbi:hypothetical protein BH23PAT2_BH23PAT2_07930 [soil metagenome]